MRRAKEETRAKKDANLQENLSSIPILFICPEECRLKIKKNEEKFSQDNLKLLEIDEIA